MADEIAGPSSCPLLELPHEILLDVCTRLEGKDLAQLRLLNHFTKDLVDDELLWRRLLQDDYNFPSQASARITGWQKLYRGLSRPYVFVWGQRENSRLGIRPDELSEEVRYLMAQHRGAPFPLELDYRKAQRTAAAMLAGDGKVDLGAPVEIVAGGWSFHILTSRGEVLFWGQLDGYMWDESDDLSSPGVQVQSPQVLRRATSDPVRSLSCGRAHAVALTSKQDILEWHNWSMANRHDTLLQMSDPERRTNIAQLEAGWDFTVVLLHSTSLSKPSQHATSEIVYWQSHNQPVSATSWQQGRRETLPPLPEPSEAVAAELPQEDPEAHQLITQVAAGERWIVALTRSGLLYKIHPWSGIRADGIAREWVLLEHFCLPSKIAQLDHFKESEAAKSLISSDLRITHVSGQFRNFVAYTPERGQSQTHLGDEAKPGGIVLLGNDESFKASKPIVKPELQGIGVIKVSMGDWHYGALTSSGQLYTWGQWSQGALGTWDSLPLHQSATVDRPTSTPATPRREEMTPQPMRARGGLSRFGRIGFAGRRIRVHSNVAEAEQAGHYTNAGVPPPPTETGSTRSGASSNGRDWLAWQERMKARQVPQGNEKPTRVIFDPARQDKNFVFDIAFAGWHSAALSIDGTLLGNGNGEEEGEKEEVRSDEISTAKVLHSSSEAR